jgi:hypothetical protein
MKLALVKSVSFLVSAAVLAIGWSEVSAQEVSAPAELVNSSAAETMVIETAEISSLPTSMAIGSDDQSLDPASGDLALPNMAASSTHVAVKPILAEPTSSIDAAPVVPDQATNVPVPGTVALSAALLTNASPSPKAAPSPSVEAPNVIAQDVVPGRATRSGPSYIGIGGNIGIGDGDTALGEGSFAILSKIGLTQRISVRPSVLIENDVTILLPVTYDFYPVGEENIDLSIAPFIGAGLAISLGDDSAVDLLATAGVDVPLGRLFTATASVNASLFDNPAIGVLLGIGYNF